MTTVCPKSASTILYALPSAPTGSVLPIWRPICCGAIRHLLAVSGHQYRRDECLLSGVKRTWRGRDAMSAYDPKRTSRDRTKPCPSDAFCGSQASVYWRGHPPSAIELTNLFVAFCAVPMEPNASWRVLAPRTRRRGRIHLSRRGSHHETLSKIQSGDGLARTSRAYAERPADEYRGEILQVRR
jgi:hypothetical protein